MSGLREAFRSRILTSAAGEAARGGVSWVERPQGTGFPAITLTLVSPGRRYDHDGFDGLSTPRIQADIWAETYAETVLIGDAYIAVIEWEATVDAIKFGPGFLDSDMDMPPVPASGRGTTSSGRDTIFRRSIDIILSWESA